VVRNGGLAAEGGFSDMDAVGSLYVSPQIPFSVHEYAFYFEGATVSEFSLRMLDFGDYNPDRVPYHLVEMIATNASNDEVASQFLEYMSDLTTTPRTSDYGDLACDTGDASTIDGNPGNWKWEVSGTGITKITLTFPEGYDPYIGFDTLCFVVEP
jgi:hypothetical protein